MIKASNLFMPDLLGHFASCTFLTLVLIVAVGKRHSSVVNR